MINVGPKYITFSLFKVSKVKYCICFAFLIYSKGEKLTQRNGFLFLSYGGTGTPSSKLQITYKLNAVLWVLFLTLPRDILQQHRVWQGVRRSAEFPVMWLMTAQLPFKKFTGCFPESLKWNQKLIPQRNIFSGGVKLYVSRWQMAWIGLNASLGMKNAGA